MNLDSTKGLLILDVAPGGPAAQAGVSGGSSTTIINGVELPIGGDVIVAADSVPISKFEDLVSYIDENLRPGDTMVLTVIRDNVEIQIAVILAERPL